MTNKFSKELLIRNFSLSLALISIGLYLYAVCNLSINAPYGDDYDAILNFLNQFEISNLKQQILLLFSQHNEHRIALTRFAALLSYKASGQVNFIHMIWLGNIGWGLTILVFWKWAQSQKISLVEFSPVIILLVCFSHHELITWAMASTQQYYQILFAVISIYLMSISRTYSSLFFYGLAAFTGGGGITLGPLIALNCLIHRKWKEFFISIAAIAAVLTIYFYWIEYIPNPQAPGSLKIMMRPDLLIGFVLGYIGSIGHINKIGSASGILLGATLSILFAKRIMATKNLNFLEWLILYIYSISFLAAITRGGFGIEYAQTNSRYTPYSLLFVAAIYLIYIDSKSQQKIKKMIFVIGLLFSISCSAYWFPRGVVAMKARYLELHSGAITHPDKSKALEILGTSRDRHIY